jgi:preprotein translocase subunit SecE
VSYACLSLKTSEKEEMLPSCFSHKIRKGMNKIKVYLRDVYVELATKVTWPTWKDLQSSAILVMIASIIFALVVFVMDFSFENIIRIIYSILLGKDTSSSVE